MKFNRILLAAAVVGLTPVLGSAAELKAEHSVRGRSGIVTIVKSEKATPTIALSRSGEGIGTQAPDERMQVKHRWHNASRPIPSSAARAAHQEQE